MEKAFAAAFEKWEQEFREDPDRFMTRAAMDAQPAQTVAQAQARVFVSYLNELAGGRPWSDIGR